MRETSQPTFQSETGTRFMTVEVINRRPIAMMDCKSVNNVKVHQHRTRGHE